MVGSQIVALSAVYERNHRDLTLPNPWETSPRQCSVSPPITRAHKRGCRIPQTARRTERNELHRQRPAMSVLPPKWTEAKDAASGDTYFWNIDTNETSWDRPVAPPTAGLAPPPPPRRREQLAKRCDDPEQLLLNPPDPNLICPICLKLFTQPVRTACGCACRLRAPCPHTTTRHCLAEEARLALPSGSSMLTPRALR